MRVESLDPECRKMIELIDRRRIDIKTVRTAGKPALQLLQQLFDHGVLDSDE